MGAQQSAAAATTRNYVDADESRERQPDDGQRETTDRETAQPHQPRYRHEKSCHQEYPTLLAADQCSRVS